MKCCQWCCAFVSKSHGTNFDYCIVMPSIYPTKKFHDAFISISLRENLEISILSLREIYQHSLELLQFAKKEEALFMSMQVQCKFLFLSNPESSLKTKRNHLFKNQKGCLSIPFLFSSFLHWTFVETHHFFEVG